MAGRPTDDPGDQVLEAVCSRKRGPRTTIPAAAVDVPDLLGRDFTSDTVGAKLVGDITYLNEAETQLSLDPPSILVGSLRS